MSDPGRSLPRMFCVQSSDPNRRIDDIESSVKSSVAACPALESVRSGDSVAIAVGSRGIDRIDRVVRAVVNEMACRGAKPFIVPAMGSHGGATAEGQVATLRSLGITEASVGCQIRATMETVSLGNAAGIDLFFDANASKADHVIVINRIKPHTRLIGTIQSGLCKMLMIGLGKRRGAIEFHPAFRSFDYQLETIVDDVVSLILEKTNVRFGVAVIEDAYDSIGYVDCIVAAEMISREKTLLKTAVDWMPKLPFKTADVLIIDEIGKEISGTGMDTNVIGRKWHDKMAGENEWPKINEIYVRSLTAKTAGNASGIGIAEYTHRRVVDAIDHEKTRVNCLTANHATAAATPLWLDRDQDVLSAICVQTPQPAASRRWMWIRNTLELSNVWCSEAYRGELEQRSDLTVLDGPVAFEFDDNGQLIPR
ncbi:nickel pincer cofactor-dependent isomerase, group 22 [Roseiconus lacunae]|uniref:lactate racemase domain-containing protein n=1 Tax=Roseiconus lacunae TaxID=2605694 RepID=UPI0011F1D88B|nr:lactate racemase domain-containing protein [Roseiconus lacunae]